MNGKVAVIAAVSIPAAVAVCLTLAVTSDSSANRQERLRSASTACTSALGIPADNQTTINDLGGTQAVTVLGNTATSTRATAMLDALYRIGNWRDLDPAAVAQWAHSSPDSPLPPGAAINPFAATAPAVQPDSYRDVSDAGGYEDRCSTILNTLTPEQLARATTAPLIDTRPTPESLRAADAAQELLGQHISPQEFLARVLAAAYPDTPDLAATPSQAIWLGTRVAPASATRGDLIVFDYTSAGPSQIAITLGPTAVATTTGLDTPADPPGTVVTAHAPPGNVAVLRFTSPTASSTERPPTP